MRLLALALLLPALLPAQEKKVFYYPKPVARTAYQPPMKPVMNNPFLTSANSSFWLFAPVRHARFDMFPDVGSIFSFRP